MVISLDLAEKVYPVIYSLHHLPYDSLQLVSMPKPIHGMMVISANALLHVSQGSPGVGVAVNAYAKTTTAFPGMKFDPLTVQLGLVLDGARALYLSDGVCLLFLQNGDWVLVKFIRDGNKIVSLQLARLPFGQVKVITSDSKNKRNPTYQHTPVALIPTCVCKVKDSDYFFVGSRVGNSLLVKWKSKGTFARKASIGKMEGEKVLKEETFTLTLRYRHRKRLLFSCMRRTFEHGTYHGYGNW